MDVPRVLLADDHLLVSTVIRHLLEPEFEVLETVSNGRLLVDRAQILKPSVIITDICMPEMNGIYATEQIKKILPQIKIVVLTMYGGAAYLRAALRAGASAYLLKQSAPGELRLAVRNAIDGQTYVSPAVLDERQTSPQLTIRQTEVLGLIAQGFTAKEIATRLKFSVRTAEFHRNCIMNKLNAHSTAALTRYAIEYGFA